MIKRAQQQDWPVVLVMGVCGVGKSTVAGQLAGEFGGTYIEADDYHLPESVKAMRRGLPLNDEMRWEWLARICQAVNSEAGNGGRPVIVACSALKKRYRDFMRREMGPILILHLDGDPDLVRSRLAARKDHFMPPALLQSQLDDLEPPRPGIEEFRTLDISDDRKMVAITAINQIRRYVADAGATGHSTPSANPAAHPKSQIDDPQEGENHVKTN